LQLVPCARRNMRLTDTACARSWIGANPEVPPVWEGRHVCHLCPAGAARAGAVVDAMAGALAPLLRTCTRCRRPCDRIINTRLCVSCYNRECEVRKGLNSKGHFPARVARRLHAASVVAIEGGRVEHVHADLSTGVGELLLARTRRASRPVIFGWAPAPLQVAS
jgi:hypothetical protein